MNETYHSVHGAWQESVHVFIKNGLDYFAATNSKEEINVLEIGFGTGLNALLTLLEADKLKKKISYTTLEAYPLEESIWSRLNYGEASKDVKRNFINIHQVAWDELVGITPCFSIKKVRNTLQSINLKESEYDLIFYDAFAPGKQPEMWEFPMLEKVVRLMSEGALFVTYCAKGQLKRDLKTLQLSVESPPGPPGKMQMVRASKRARMN